jgi:signal transduction histidine kinase/putative methionine-R-sulfoxide reductase with GAF domain
MSSRSARKTESSVLTVWKDTYFKKGSGSNLQTLFVSPLESVARQIPNESTAVYLREKGHLLLILSSDKKRVPKYRTILPLTKFRRLLENDVTLSPELSTADFIIKTRPTSLLSLSLRIGAEPKGMLLLCNPKVARVAGAKMTRIKPALNNLATLLSTINVVQREKERSSRLALINKLCQQADSMIAESNLYDRIVTLIQEFFHYDHVGIYLIDKKKSVFVLQSLAGKYKGIIFPGQTIPFGQGIVSWVATHGQTLLSNDVRENPYFLNLTPDLIPTEAELCVPIRVDDEIIGVLNIEHSELLSFDQDDLNSIEVLAGRIAVAIKKSRLYDELHRSHARLEAVVSSMGQGLMIIDREFRIQWMNNTLERWGYGGMQGECCFNVWSGSPDYCKTCPSQRTFESGTICQDTIRGRGDRYYAVTSAPIPDPNGNVNQVLEVIDDITAQVSARGEMEHLKHELERSQRLAAIGEVAANIVHEIRNPINAMSQAVELLETDLKLTGEQHQLMDVVKEECVRLNEAISSHLSLVSGKQREFVVSSLKSIVEKVVKLLRADQSISRRIKLTMDFPEALPPIRLDPNAIRQVFWNLLLNSVESIETQGNVSVCARYQQPQTYVIVTDDGRGIASDRLEKIFDPFYTTKGRGTGLGLAIVKRIIEDHGWKIAVESEQHGGTRITITIDHPQD